MPFLMYKAQQNRSQKIQNASVFFQLGIFCRLFSCENQIVSIITGRWGVMFDLGSTVIPVNFGARTALLTEEYKKTCPMEMSCVLENLRKTMRIIVEKKNLNPFYSSDMAAVIAVGGFR